MAKYRKKPVVIEAIQYMGDNSQQIYDFCAGGVNFTFRGMSIQTLEGHMLISPGDYVIKGVAGEFYPCKPDVFKASYDIILAGESGYC